MPGFLERVFGSPGFMPHGHCYLWQSDLVWLHVLSDGVIAASYMTIPLTLGYLVQRRRDLPFTTLFWAFAVFIVSCGVTHLLEIWTLWTPLYWLSGWAKAVTAAASVTTAVMLVAFLPRALALPSPAQLRRAENRLRAATDGMIESFIILECMRSPEGAIVDFRVVEANPPMLAELGTSRADAIGARLLGLPHPSRFAFERLVRVAESRKRIEEETSIELAPGSELRWIHRQVVPLEDGVAVTTRDISEQKRSERLAQAELLLKEVHHRVKNNLQVVSSILKLHAEQLVDPAAQAAFRDSQDRVRAIALLHERLHQSKKPGDVDIGEYAESLVPALLRAYGRAGVHTQVEARGIALPVDTAVPFGLILNELVANAFKHAFAGDEPGGSRLDIVLEAVEGDYLLTVRDNGRGFPPGFDLARSSGLGFYIVKTLTRQLAGTLSLASPGGAECRLRFPKPAERSAS